MSGEMGMEGKKCLNDEFFTTTTSTHSLQACHSQAWNCKNFKKKSERRILFEIFCQISKDGHGEDERTQKKTKKN